MIKLFNEEQRRTTSLTTQHGAVQRLALTTTCALLLANSRFFNEQLSRNTAPLAASFISHAFGLLFLAALLLIPGLRVRSMCRLARNQEVMGTHWRPLFLILSAAVCSVGVVFFANATAVEVRTSAAIPLFLAFIVVFSLVLEAARRELTPQRMALAGISLVVSIAFLTIQNGLLTAKGVCLAAAASLSLIVSRTKLRALSEASTPFLSCVFVHGVLGVVGFTLLGLNPDWASQVPLQSCLGGILGAGFQVLLVITLQRYGDLVSNTLIQTEQVLFGYLTAFY